MPDSTELPPPPFCPNPVCEFHLNSKGWHFKRAGFFHRQLPPLRVQRYQCSRCRRCFSSQTYSATYWLKRPDLLERVLRMEVACSGHRQIARSLDVSHSTIQRHAEHLGRLCLLFHERFRARALQAAPTEDIVLDGLGSFAGGQYWPFELNNLIGAKSYYSHDFTITEKRRGGRMRDDQLRRNDKYEEQLGRPDPRALKHDTRDLLEFALPKKVAITLRSDEKTEYVWALKRLEEHKIEHKTTHSKQPRTLSNPLFAINAHHMFMRHSAGNHKRETVAFSKRLQSAIYRHATFQAWRNYVKNASERNPGTTPAQRLGVTKHQLEFSELLRERIFPSQVNLNSRLKVYYGGRVKSRFCRNERRHSLFYAY
jgi:transposase-like protein